MELVNYPGYIIYEDDRIQNKKTKIYLKCSKDGVFPLSRKPQGQKGVKLTTLQYEQKHICVYEFISHTLFMGKPVVEFRCRVKGLPKYKIFQERFKTLEKAMLYKFFFIMKLNLGLM